MVEPAGIKRNASASSRIWYGNHDPQSRNGKVPLDEQSNQTGKPIAILITGRFLPVNVDLRITSDSKYTTGGLTSNVKSWEAHEWMNVRLGEIFKCTTARIR